MAPTEYGQMQVSPYSEYQPNAVGFVIEFANYWNGGELSWALPAWDEMGMGDDADGIFPTQELAIIAMKAI